MLREVNAEQFGRLLTGNKKIVVALLVSNGSEECVAAEQWLEEIIAVNNEEYSQKFEFCKFNMDNATFADACKFPVVIRCLGGPVIYMHSDNMRNATFSRSNKDYTEQRLRYLANGGRFSYHFQHIANPV